MDRVPTFALLTVRLDGWYQSQAWHGAAMAANLLGVRVVALVGSAYGEQDQRGGPPEIYRLASSAKFDGYLPLVGALANLEGTGPVEDLLRSLPPRPTVCIGMGLPGFASVVPDGGGIDDVVRHLTGVHGLRRIAFIGGPAKNPDAQFRKRQFLSCLEEAGIEPDPLLFAEADFTPSTARAAVARMLDSCALPQAIVCANDAMALGVRKDLLERGLRIPEDILITGYDDIEEARITRPSLTSVDSSTYQVAFRSVELLLEMIHGKPPSQESVPTSLIVRRSCGCRTAATNFALPKLMAEVSRAPNPQKLREILSDPTASEGFLLGLESTFDQAEHAEIDHWEQQLLAAANPPPPPEVSKVIMEAHTIISQARHGLDVRRRQSLQHLMRDEYIALQALLDDLSLETLPHRLLDTLTRFSNSRLRILLFRRDLAPIDTQSIGFHEFQLEIDTWSGRVGPPGPDCLLPPEEEGPGRWVTLSISLGTENYGVIQFREWTANELFLESFRMSLWMVLSSARKDHREKLAMTELKKLSSRDDLTGLMNRRGILEQGEVLVQSARRSRSRIGVVLCDLDGLKEINDRYGHADGDIAIQCLARALEDGFRQSDVVGRLGGDEFAVLTILGAEGSLQGAIDRVRHALQRRSTEIGKPWRARTSAGWMTWEPWDGNSLAEAMKKADDLLYHDKRERKARSGEITSPLEAYEPPPPAPRN